MIASAHPAAPHTAQVFRSDAPQPRPIVDIPGVIKQLFYQLAAALATAIVPNAP